MRNLYRLHAKISLRHETREKCNNAEEVATDKESEYFSYIGKR
jgi:hypothetical protein